MVEEKKKNPFQKLKEGLDDKEEQLAVISLFVRLGVVVWSGFIVTLNYRHHISCFASNWCVSNIWFGGFKEK